MFFSGMLIFVGTIVATFGVLEFVQPLRHTNPFAG
jgi:hypothetical protein